MFKTIAFDFSPNKLVRNYLRLFHHISKNLLNRNIILDRLLHHSKVINIVGRSYRTKDIVTDEE